MNKLLAVIAVMLILLCAGAYADSRKVQLPHVAVYYAYDVNGVIGVENNFRSQLKDLKATIMIPELGLRASSSTFKLSSGGDTVKQLMLDAENAAPGEYYVRITVGNGDVKRVKYRIITIE
ncbi:MAG: hypothetical protein V1702_06310 [Candidatus Woesearchaeota archaeon]